MSNTVKTAAPLFGDSGTVVFGSTAVRSVAIENSRDKTVQIVFSGSNLSGTLAVQHANPTPTEKARNEITWITDDTVRDSDGNLLGQVTPATEAFGIKLNFNGWTMTSLKYTPYGITSLTGTLGGRGCNYTVA